MWPWKNPCRSRSRLKTAQTGTELSKRLYDRCGGALPPFVYKKKLSRSSWTKPNPPRVTPAPRRAHVSSAFDSSQAQQKLRLITAAQRARPPKLLDLSQPSTRSAPVQQPWLRHRCERRSSSPQHQPSRRAPRASPRQRERGRPPPSR